MMLRIKRVPTVVSNFQKEEAEEDSLYAGGCGRNCFRSCCLPGAKLPMYTFKTVNKIQHEKKSVGSENKEPPFAFLDSLPLGEWEVRMQRGLFRYDVTACETKVIPGQYGFIAQLNEGRHIKKGPTDMENEVQFFPNAPIDVENSPSVVAINVSPIEYGHVLFIPRILECLPQRIDQDSFLLALYMAAEAGNPYFRLGYNSLGAFATINHLHFQAYYLAVQFPIEKAPTRKITTTNGGVKICDVLNYPVRDSCICLQDNNIPYNVLIADSGKRIFLFPQCYAEKQALGEVSSELLDTRVNPAVWEISGHMVLKRKEDYEEASEQNVWRLLAEVSLSEERLHEVKELLFEAISCSMEEDKGVTQNILEESDVSPQSLEDVDALQGSNPAVVSV
ncbi:GDP-L-galactose phosphorylase 2-like [Olea europaea subsp. europaea]|uniref:GDP-L-galactose phosphorylase 2-like n=1 Tax=Olea europaea subsp. europaea TaxID=158383 RepID=A0A8S0VDS2_OLEEU|nr:GDP-L-galactose phosphorylase 2-like [Olea europaea subsp. europaea]